ncbi:MAG: alpha/beta hydrolase [Bdellovibrionota bacterium]
MANSAEISWLANVHLPPKERSEKERLLLVMHGLGDSLEGFRFLPDMLKIQGLHTVLVNAPDRYFTGYSWFDIYSGDMKAGIVRSRDLLIGAMDELNDQGWASEHVGVLGFSQGCLMALDLACRYPKKLGAVVGISGFVGMLNEYPEKLSPVARTQKILVTHGTMDPMLPLAETQKQIKALQGMGMNIEWKVYEKEHTVEPYKEVQDIRTFLVRNLMK